jgi:hypothetical protein
MPADCNIYYATVIGTFANTLRYRTHKLHKEEEDYKVFLSNFIVIDGNTTSLVILSNIL